MNIKLLIIQLRRGLCNMYLSNGSGRNQHRRAALDHVSRKGKVQSKGMKSTVWFFEELQAQPRNFALIP